jgi:hypothetical protein
VTAFATPLSAASAAPNGIGVMSGLTVAETPMKRPPMTSTRIPRSIRATLAVSSSVRRRSGLAIMGYHQGSARIVRVTCTFPPGRSSRLACRVLTNTPESVRLKFYKAARKHLSMHFLGNLQLPLNSAESEAPGRQFEKGAETGPTS